MKKKEMVTFRSGWFFFAGGLTLSFVFALLLRTVLSSAQIKYWLDEEIQKAQLPVSIEYSQARLEFSRGGLPWLGLVAENVIVVSHDTCLSRSEFRTPQVRIDLSLWSFLQNKSFIGAVTFGDSQFRFLPGSCEKGPTLESSGHSSDHASFEFPIKNLWEKKIDEFQSQYQKIFEKSEKKLLYGMKTLLFTRLEVVDGKGLPWKLVFENLVLKPTQKEGVFGLSWTSQSTLEKEGVDEERNFFILEGKTLNFSGFISSQTSLIQINGNYKEGYVDWRSEIDWSTGHLQLDLANHQIPLSPLWELLRDKNQFTVEEPSKYMWFNCHMNYSGGIKELELKPLNIKDCSIEGNMGQVHLSSAEWFLSGETHFNPFIIEVKNLDVRKIVHLFHRIGPSGVLSQYGLLSGQLKVDAPEQMNFQGNVRDVEMAFSNRGTREKQRISNVGGYLSLRGTKLKGELNEIELEGGTFNGLVHFDYDRKLKDGQFVVSVKSFRFNESIQRLMMGGSLSDIDLQGTGKIVESQLHSWVGNLSLKSAQTEDWIINGGVLNTQWMEDVFLADFKISQITLLKSGSVYPLFKPLLFKELNLDKKDSMPSEKIDLQHAMGKIELSDRSGGWKKVQAQTLNHTRLFSEGEWDDSRDLHGKIKVQPSGKKKARPTMIWEVTGSLDHIQVQPNAQLKEELNRYHPSLAMPTSIEFIRAGELLVKEISTQGVEHIMSFGKKVMETARRMIPGEPSEENDENKNSKKSDQ